MTTAMTEESKRVTVAALRVIRAMLLCVDDVAAGAAAVHVQAAIEAVEEVEVNAYSNS